MNEQCISVVGGVARFVERHSLNRTLTAAPAIFNNISVETCFSKIRR